MSRPSVLEYARYHGLATDTQSENLLAQVDSHVVAGDASLDLLDDFRVSSYPVIPTDSNLQVSREAFSLLSECMISLPSPDWKAVLQDCQPLSNLKVEMPMLISDHEKDMRWFKKRVDLGKLIRDYQTIPESPINDSLPDLIEECKTYASSVHTQVRQERLELTSKVMETLADCISDSWTETETEEVIRKELKATRVLCWPIVVVTFDADHTRLV